MPCARVQISLPAPRAAQLASLSAGNSGNNRICHCQSKFERKRSADLTIRPEIKYSRTKLFIALLVPPIVVLIHQATEQADQQERTQLPLKVKR